MRIIYLLLMLACLPSANAQDFCKQITKEVSPDKKNTELNSPLDQQEVTTIRLTRNINTDPDDGFDNFFMIFRVVGDMETIYTKNADGEQIEKEETKLVIEFTDQTKIVDDTIRISHDFTGDKSQAIRYVYFPLTEATLKDLTAKKISKITLAGYDKAIPADYANAIMHYVDCVKKAK
jgi:hypothetical protein